MFSGTNSILQNIPHIQPEYEEYSTKYLSVPENTVTDLNNVMTPTFELPRFSSIPQLAHNPRLTIYS